MSQPIRLKWMPVLISLRDKLAAIPGVNSCKIGMENDITPDHYPLIRLVPTRMARSLSNSQRSTMELLIYFGHPTHNFEQPDSAAVAPDIDAEPALQGLEEVYARLLELESQIVSAIRVNAGYVAEHIETLTDEDRLQAYKLFAARFEITT